MEVSPPAPPDRRAIVREALALFAVATLLTAGLYQLTRVLPPLEGYLAAMVAVVFLYLPAWAAWRRGEELSQWGFTFGRPARTLAFGLGAPLLVFPLFAVGFVTFYQLVCGDGAGALAELAPPGFCRRFLGWEGLDHPRLPKDALESALAQVIVVALPEELFFRGYLLGRLELAMPPRLRWLGGGLGAALLLSSLLFALGHVLVDLDPRRLAVFFPGLLFGWMRSATGSVAAGVMCHAAANLYIDTLHRTFFR